ncbi:60S ribosomal protein L23, partial [Plecturocebus cupreus]
MLIFLRQTICQWRKATCRPAYLIGGKPYLIHQAGGKETENLYIILVKEIKAQLNSLPDAGVGAMVMSTVKKDKPELRRKVSTKSPQVVALERKKGDQLNMRMVLKYTICSQTTAYR